MRVVMAIVSCALLGPSAAAEPPPMAPPATGAQQPTQEACQAPTDQNAEACASLFGTMMQYQKMLNKEQREDRRLKGIDRQRELNAKAAVIKADNQAIDKGMEESREKAEAAQQAGGPVAASPIEGVVQAKPAVGEIAKPCRAPTDPCVEPCKIPPCN